ncbi:MAG: anti-sigma factor [Gemmataceae bacterium]
MTNPHDPLQTRVLELLADRAVFGLSPEEEAELNAMLASVPLSQRDALDLLAADIARVGVPEIPEPLPPDLHARILADAQASFPASNPAAPSARSRTLRSLASGLAIAATVLIAVGLWWNARPDRVPTYADRRNELLARASQPGSDVIRLEWSGTADPAARGASGDLVWDNVTQEGYMLFRGLAANTPSREQYQLWVFDAARDERYPVDGGVFDIPVGGGDVVVPIRVKLGVTRPTLFAVTVEPPGGVVVSSRERLPLLAKVPAKAG